MIHRYSKKLAGIYADRGIIPEEDEEIYSYGLEILIATVFTITVLLLSGLCLHKGAETLILLMVYCPIRTFAGGYHTDSNLKCISAFILLYFLILSIYTGLKGTQMPIGYFILALVYICNIIILMLAPIESSENPLPYKRKKGMKRKAFYFTFFYTAVITYIQLLDRTYANFALLGSVAIIWVTTLVVIGKIKYKSKEVR
ncbi:accessory gene regulator B family protein [Anaerocolumna sp. AGMB13025]|jgi:accessory gene regulator B|uniref:accessory gene regulator ArgB-like protein n=1 Tax=Anaerocolumna sp. AGMB13025 TaxID=3039116 RepID=UPI00241D2C47|nr:accessory gene regulator B family protein [Anaerocolumna sp. AGMB13025]WFR56996.1 accessory gene regulator B family protein [Anaerocolumna sp. AGMB13025]